MTLYILVNFAVHEIIGGLFLTFCIFYLIHKVKIQNSGSDFQLRFCESSRLLTCQQEPDCFEWVGVEEFVTCDPQKNGKSKELIKDLETIFVHFHNLGKFQPITELTAISSDKRFSRCATMSNVTQISLVCGCIGCQPTKKSLFQNEIPKADLKCSVEINIELFDHNGNKYQ